MQKVFPKLPDQKVNKHNEFILNIKDIFIEILNNYINENTKENDNIYNVIKLDGDIDIINDYNIKIEEIINDFQKILNNLDNTPIINHITDLKTIIDNEKFKDIFFQTNGIVSEDKPEITSTGNRTSLQKFNDMKEFLNKQKKKERIEAYIKELADNETSKKRLKTPETETQEKNSQQQSVESGSRQSSSTVQLSSAASAAAQGEGTSPTTAQEQQTTTASSKAEQAKRRQALAAEAKRRQAKKEAEAEREEARRRQAAAQDATSLLGDNNSHKLFIEKETPKDDDTTIYGEILINLDDFIKYYDIESDFNIEDLLNNPSKEKLNYLLINSINKDAIIKNYLEKFEIDDEDDESVQKIKNLFEIELEDIIRLNDILQESSDELIITDDKKTELLSKSKIKINTKENLNTAYSELKKVLPELPDDESELTPEIRNNIFNYILKLKNIKNFTEIKNKYLNYIHIKRGLLKKEKAASAVEQGAASKAESQGAAASSSAESQQTLSLQEASVSPVAAAPGNVINLNYNDIYRKIIVNINNLIIVYHIIGINDFNAIELLSKPDIKKLNEIIKNLNNYKNNFKELLETTNEKDIKTLKKIFDKELYNIGLLNNKINPIEFQNLNPNNEQFTLEELNINPTNEKELNKKLKDIQNKYDIENIENIKNEDIITDSKFLDYISIERDIILIKTYNSLKKKFETYQKYINDKIKELNKLKPVSPSIEYEIITKLEGYIYYYNNTLNNDKIGNITGNIIKIKEILKDLETAASEISLVFQDIDNIDNYYTNIAKTYFSFNGTYYTDNNKLSFDNKDKKNKVFKNINKYLKNYTCIVAKYNDNNNLYTLYDKNNIVVSIIAQFDNIFIFQMNIMFYYNNSKLFKKADDDFKKDSLTLLYNTPCLSKLIF